LSARECLELLHVSHISIQLLPCCTYLVIDYDYRQAFLTHFGHNNLYIYVSYTKTTHITKTTNMDD